MPEFNTRDPWERQEDESVAYYMYFEAYLALGRKRYSGGITATAKVLGRDRATISTIANKYGWQSRALAYDAHNAALYKAELEDAQRELIKEEAKQITIDHALARSVSSIVGSTLVAINQRLADKKDKGMKRELTETSIKSLVEAAKVAMEMRRVSIGLPSTITGVATSSTASLGSEEGEPSFDNYEEAENYLLAIRDDIDKRVTEIRRLKDLHVQAQNVEPTVETPIDPGSSAENIVQ